MSLSACEDLCLNTSRCTGITVSAGPAPPPPPPPPGTTVVGVAPDPNDSSQMGWVYVNDSNSSAIMHAKGEPCGQGFWAQAGALSRGSDLGGWPRNTTIDVAQAACSADVACIGITYHSSNLFPDNTTTFQVTIPQ